MMVYIASRFRNKSGVKQLTAKFLTAKPPIHAIQSWPDEPEDNRPGFSAKCDLEEIQSADAVIVWTEDCELVPGGMHFEAGYALGLGKRVIQIGPRVNIFYHLPTIEHYDTIQDFFKELQWITI